ncbi:DUF397 domain-containing protein [Nonomuraea sp. NPDC052265]|uniref:DUF397 domain-containing protein n=1 Tax=Nonomuraea sp. NPDC052265 TaxID=3364374 RepID=UPI0037C602F9
MSNEQDLGAFPRWRASSRCNNGDCVEVAYFSHDSIGVRDNKNPNSPVLTFSATEWNAFIGRIREAG